MFSQTNNTSFGGYYTANQSSRYPQTTSVFGHLPTVLSSFSGYDKPPAVEEVVWLRANWIMNRDELCDAQRKLEDYATKVEELEELIVKSQKDNQELKNSLEDYEKDNKELKKKIEQLEHEKEYTNDKNVNFNETDNRIQVCDDFEQEINRVTQSEADKSTELETVRLFIKKEISSLSSTSSLSFDELGKKTVTDLFQIFINEIMKRENIIIAQLISGYEKDKSKLEEKIKQSVDAEKKLSIWANELEANVERLQSDSSAEKKKSLRFVKNIFELEKMLQESEHNMHLIRTDNNNQMKNLRDLNDELEVEKIKSTGLNKQLADITNRNLVIQSQLNKLSEKCEELESLNNRLNRKIRNSTDKKIVKLQTAELVDQNKILQRNLEDTTNRMTELQNARSELLKINDKLQQQCQMLEKKKETCICGKRIGNIHITKVQSSKEDIKIPSSVSMRSKQRRNNLFNQNRPKELTEELLVTEVTENPICQCDNLRKKVIELEQELALKLAKVKSLQLTLNSKIFLHQKKCKALEELVLAYKRKNNELKAELDRISVHQSLNNDCKKCLRRTLTRKNQYTQCMPFNNRITMVSEASVVVVEHLRIAKLESDKNELKKLCISRLNQIKELCIAKAEAEQELENLRLETSSVIKNYPTLPSLATKENVPSNILGTLGMKPHNVRKD